MPSPVSLNLTYMETRFFDYTLFLLEARCVCRQAAVKAAKIWFLDGLARFNQDPVNRGHGAQYLYRPPPAGAEWKHVPAGIARVVELLTLSGSCYLPGFLSLRASLDREAATAQSNVQFMSVLEEPCAALEKAAPHVRSSLKSKINQ